MPDLDILRIERLRRTLAAVSAAHPFYRARFQALKINAQGIRSLDDLAALPLTDKSETLSTLAGIGEFQIMFADRDRPEAMERLVIRIERDSGAAIRAEEDLRDEVTRRVRAAVSLRPEVEFVPRGALYDHERSIKAKRVLDLRKRVD